jgi:hypothetical protein
MEATSESGRINISETVAACQRMPTAFGLNR